MNGRQLQKTPLDDRAAEAAKAVRSACEPSDRFVLVVIDSTTGQARSHHNLASDHEAAGVVAGMYEVAFRGNR